MSRQIVRGCLVWLALLVGVAVQPASAAVRTTVPGVVYVVKLTITDKTVAIPKDKFSKGLPYARYPRGAVIRYKIINKGTRPYSLTLWDVTTPVIRPGHSDTVLVNWNYRGTFTYASLYHGKPLGPHGRIKIF
jgi:hypothetical protein